MEALPKVPNQAGGVHPTICWIDSTLVGEAEGSSKQDEGEKGYAEVKEKTSEQKNDLEEKKGTSSTVKGQMKRVRYFEEDEKEASELPLKPQKLLGVRCRGRRKGLIF